MVFDTRGSLIKNKDLSQITWLRVGGPADFFFIPTDTQDLIDFASLDVKLLDHQHLLEK